MGGTADGGQTAGQDAPEDLVTVREAAQVVGVVAGTVHSWVKVGRLTAYAQPSPQGRQVSLGAVRALCAPSDPQTPTEARLVYEVARAVGVSKGRIRIWAQQGLLPSWHGLHGLLVCVADVQKLAQQHSMTVAAAGDDTPMPPDALSVGDVVRLSGVTESRLYMWMKKGLLPVWPVPGSGRRVRLADVVALMERPGRALPRKPVDAP